MPLRAPRGFIDETDPKVCLIGHPAPAWLVNYADLMTELVCFFVILYALSAALNKDVQKAKQEVEKMIDQKQVQGEVKLDKDGLKITLEEQGKNVFFESGSAELTPAMEGLLVKIAPVLKDLVKKHEVVIEGHTDTVGIKNDLYLSNWELSTARATTVVEHMISQHGFPPTQMAASGYGEFRPAVPNDTPENRSKNRRVVFFVKNSPLKPETVKKAGEAQTAVKAAAKEQQAAAVVPKVKKPGFFAKTWSSVKALTWKYTPAFIKKRFAKSNEK